MTEKTNRRDLIMDTAIELFTKQGYAATSVRQIADGAGVTEAALYYHFKDGKRALLQAVIERNAPDMMAVIKRCEEAQSLAELVMLFGKGYGEFGQARLSKIRWLIKEFPTLSHDERCIIQGKHLRLAEALLILIKRFESDPDRANDILWTLICAAFGYGQYFQNMDMISQVDFPYERLFQVLAEALTKE